MAPLTKSTLPGEERDKALLEKADSYIYHTTSDGHELQGHFFTPEQPLDEPTPFLAFFHGGMWDGGKATQFVPQCLNFTTRGLPSATFEYRTSSAHGGTPGRAIDDVQTALLGLKQNATDLGIDPNRIVAIGAGAGACAVLNAAFGKDGHIQKDEDSGLDARPAAVIGLSSLVNTAPKVGLTADLFATPAEAKELNPSGLIRKQLPPSLFLHGRYDRTIPFEQVEKFVKLMKRKRNNCELVEIEGADHSFFNFNVSENLFDLSIRCMDGFLCQLGYLEPEETLD